MLFLCYGTRPEWIKIKPVIEELRKRKIKHKVLFTGQHIDIGNFYFDFKLNLANSEITNRLDSMFSAIIECVNKTRILDQMSKEHVQKMLSKVPRGRFLELNELTSLVCWLSSEENSFSTAAVFDISGGRSTY